MKYSVVTSALIGAVAALPSGISSLEKDITDDVGDILKDFEGTLAPLLQPPVNGHSKLQTLEQAMQVYANAPKANFGTQSDRKDVASELELAFKNGTLDLLPRETAAACSANPNIRFEWDDYAETDRQALMAAFKCMMDKPSKGYAGATTRWEDFASVHQQYTPNVHNNNKFLLWHRLFLWTFEQALRDECGFDRAFVWFDETKHAGDFSGSDLFSSAYLGTLGGTSHCVTDGAFAGLTCHIGPGTGDTSHCLSRQGNAQDTAQCSTSYLNYCDTMADYKNFEPCLEYGPHGYGHNGLGGVMEDVYSSPQEPFFWFHHAFVDRAYRIWELADPSARYGSIDGTDINGNALTFSTPLYMDNLAAADGGADGTIGQVINTLGGENVGSIPVCYRYNY
ncbi:hypothetical protein F5Y16DRAFT_368554 [Xylariaceae sp. FL0255]|nr:hypothetical protein F5Y16DRAFT_368554 [Xylariaceae sp. FL0255]